MLARYVPADTDETVEVGVTTAQDLEALLAGVARQPGERGIPAIEFCRKDGSTLVVGQTSLGHVLLWMDAQGISMHSVGSATHVGTVIFDYLGAHTEVPSEYAVPASVGVSACLAVLSGRDPHVPGLMLEFD